MTSTMKRNIAVEITAVESMVVEAMERTTRKAAVVDVADATVSRLLKDQM